MRERFSNRQITAMVASVCAAIILTPVVVWAGTAVNIADPNSSARVARVTADGALIVEHRAGARSNSFNMSGGRLGLGYINLVSTTAPTRLAITELTLTARGPVSDTAQEILVEAFVRTSGSAGCTGPGTSGYTRFTLRRILVRNQFTDHSYFNGPPMVLPAGASGQPTCFGVTIVTIPSGSATDAYGIGYRFVA